MAMDACGRRDFLKALGLGAACLSAPSILRAGVASAATPSPAPKPRPNFVFILADDLGWRDVGCNGSTFYETPNIDRLAAQGLRFTDAYAACPVCSPTRASIMTGKYPARLHITNFLPANKPGKLLGPDYQLFLPLEEVTLAEALKEGGYATGFVGKWHLGESPTTFPEHQGFDVNIGGNQAGSPSSYFSPYKNPTLPDGPAGEYLTDRLTDEALKFVDANAGKPFLLYLSHYAVHNPKQGKKDLAAHFAEKAAKIPAAAGPKYGREHDNRVRLVQDDPVYAAMVKSLDESVGRVMQKLEDLKLAGNTVVIFMSDNGGLSTSEGLPTSNEPLRAGKGWLYEGGVREPLIVRWPGMIKPGVCAAPVISTDFYPTMLDLAGLPPRPAQHVDGLSLAPLLRGGAAPERKAIFWHYPHYSNQGGAMNGAVRAGDWKLIRSYEDGKTELYNLKDDLGEKNDLAAKEPAKARELNALLDDFLKRTKAQMPRPNPNWNPNAKKAKKTAPAID